MNVDTLEIVSNQQAYAFVKEHYEAKFGKESDFNKYLELYLKLPKFKANENIHQLLTDYADRGSLPDKENRFIVGDSLDPHVHWIMRMFTQFYIQQAFKAMKVDLEDPNISENSLGKGTPGRLAKMWCGNDPEDTDELGSGRWNKEPYLSCFPNEGGDKSIVTKEVDVVACCSHHFLPFSTFDGGRAIISYRPGKFILGISKLQRYVTWASRRFWLQEDLTRYIGETIKRIAETEDVYVRLEGLVHGCEKFRGANAKNGNLTTEYRSGIFKCDGGTRV